MGIVDTLPVKRVKPVLFLPLWLGTLRDHSAQAHTTVKTGSIHWSPSGDQDNIVTQSNGYISIAHASSLDLTNGTLYFYGDIRRQFTNQTFFRKVGTGVRYQLYSSNGSNIVLYDGTLSSSYNVDYIGETSICAAWTGGAKPKFYLSGSYASDGSQIVNTSGTTSSLTVLGDSANGANIPCSFVAMWADQLTSGEISDLEAWAAARFTPRKQWPGFGLRYPDRGDPYTPANGDPLYLDNLQTGRISLTAVNSGRITNTDWWYGADGLGTANLADGTDRYIDAVSGTCYLYTRIPFGGYGYGVWDFEFESDAAANSVLGLLSNKKRLIDSGANGYGLYWRSSDDTMRVAKYVNGGVNAWVAASAAVPGGRYRIRVTRGSNGDWTVSLLGGTYTTWTQICSGNDNTYTSGNYLPVLLSSVTNDKLYKVERYA